MNPRQQKAINDVTKELQEMKKLGMRVPFDTLNDQQQAEVIEYREGGMSISDIASTLILLA